MRDGNSYLYSGHERRQPWFAVKNIAYFSLFFFAVLSFGLSLFMAGIAVDYITLPANYGDFITEAIACKASGITAFLGLGLACFASLRQR